MLRLRFQKTDRAVWISHLDLMRLFQRAFQRAGLTLTHTQGFNPRPSVSIALPMSVGIASDCELLDFQLEGELPTMEEIRNRLNRALVEGISVLEVYDTGSKLKNLAYLDCRLTLEYDHGIPEGTRAALGELLSRQELMMEKTNKNGVTQVNIAPMILKAEFYELDGQTMNLQCRICCQNPTLNPMLLAGAIKKYLPELAPDFVSCRRLELFDTNQELFR